MDFFSFGTHEEARLRSPSKDYRRSHGNTSSSCDYSQCQHVRVFKGMLAAHSRLL
jgi:hypothetical protein